MTEFHEKQRRIQALLESHKLDALLLRSVSSLTEQGCEILTEMSDWPTIPIHINGQTFFRPAILERA